MGTLKRKGCGRSARRKKSGTKPLFRCKSAVIASALNELGNRPMGLPALRSGGSERPTFKHDSIERLSTESEGSKGRRGSACLSSGQGRVQKACEEMGDCSGRKTGKLQCSLGGKSGSERRILLASDRSYGALEAAIIACVFGGIFWIALASIVFK